MQNNGRNFLLSPPSIGVRGFPPAHSPIRGKRLMVSPPRSDQYWRLPFQRQNFCWLCQSTKFHCLVVLVHHKMTSGSSPALKTSSFPLPLRARFQSHLAPQFRSGKQSPALVKPSVWDTSSLCSACPPFPRLRATNSCIVRHRQSLKHSGSMQPMRSCWCIRSASPVSGSKTTRRLFRSWAAAQQKTA